MKPLMRPGEWLRRLVRGGPRDRLDAELDEELRFHLEQQVAWLVERGVEPQEARREALRRFGGVEKVKEECRDERRGRLLDELRQDLGYAGRMIRRQKGYAALIVLTLALGIGANTAIFSVVDGVLLAPLPYPAAHELAMLEAEAPGALPGGVNFSIAEFVDLDAGVEAMELVEYHDMSFTLLGHGYPSTVQTGVVSHDFFDVLGVRALLGRTFLPSDERVDAEAVLVLSNRYWREQFDADPDVVGQVFEMNDRPHRVVGVLPPLPQYPRYNDVYMPSTACPIRAFWMARMHEDRNAFRSLELFGRRAAGVDEEGAAEAMAEGAAAMTGAHPEFYDGSGYRVGVRPMHTVLTERARPLLLVLLGVVALVLLVACANAANLMLARMLQREREMSLRIAMGAGRARLLRQTITESTLLSLCGGALGLLLAGATLDALVDFAAWFTPRTDDIVIDGQVLAFTLAVSFATGIVCGLLPAWLRRGQPWQALRSSDNPHSSAGRRALRLRGGLIAAQVALSFVLLIAAGLMVRSFFKLAGVDAGFGNENVLTADVFPNWTAYDSPAARIALFSSLLEALHDGPGVVSAAISTTAPFTGNGASADIFYFERRPPALDEAIGPADGIDPHGNTVRGWPVRLVPIGISPDYLATVGIPILEGRMLNDDELSARAPAVLLSAAARRAYWPDSSPLGERIALPPPDSVERNEWVWHTVVGVVADARHAGLDREPPLAFYSSYRSLGWGGQLLVRTSTDAQTMSTYIRETVARIAPQQPVQNFRTYAGLRSASIAAPRLITLLLSLFAGLALLITVAGIGGVVAFAVGQRRHEIGIRMALGAARGSVVAMVLRQGIAMVAIGLAVGFATALWLGRLVASWLFETEPTDPVTYLGVALVLLAAAVLACLVPARRATSIDPVAVLRVD